MRPDARRPFERLLALVFAALLAVPPEFLHAGDAIDDVCAVVIAHDVSVHELEGADASANPHAEHCFICHWSQSSRLMRQTETVIVAAPAGRTASSVPGVSVSPALLDARHAGRAPPA